MITITDHQKIEDAISELTRSMKLAAERDEFEAAGDMKRIINGLQRSTLRSFTENDISRLQDKVHKITGDGEIMSLFNQLLGVSCG